MWPAGGGGREGGGKGEGQGPLRDFAAVQSERPEQVRGAAEARTARGRAEGGSERVRREWRGPPDSPAAKNSSSPKYVIN